MRLTDKVAIVTGGARGIGKGIAREFASEGARVIIVNTNPDIAQKAVDELAADGLTITARQVNVADIDAVEPFVKAVVSEFGSIDICVNNAGITRDNLLMRLKADDWDTVMNVNLKGTFNMVRAVSRPMMKARYGRIINISSVVGLTGNAGQANYAASKAGIIGLSKSAAKELASRGITVNVVAPGYIETEMTEQLTAEATDGFLSNIPLNRAGTPDDVAGVVTFLASESARYITGQTINVDGGLVM